jgi:hypothetical protein
VARKTKRERLAAKIEAALGGDPGSCRLHAAQGHYRKKLADCMPWGGYFRVGGVQLSVESWDTMTDCMRGFTHDRKHGVYTLYAEEPLPEEVRGSGALA